MNTSHPDSEPQCEGYLEPFCELHTIPSAWDVTGWMPQNYPGAEMNGTAFDQNNPHSESLYG